MYVWVYVCVYIYIYSHGLFLLYERKEESNRRLKV